MCQTLSAADFYARLDGRGLELGPAFRGVRQVDRIDGEAIARIELPAEVASEASYRMHPLLLDACVQVIAAAAPAAIAVDHVFLPMAVDRFWVLGRPGRSAWSWVRLTSPIGADTLTADLQVLDDDGLPVAELLGLRLKRAPRGNARRPAGAVGEWLHEVAWQPAPLPAPLEAAGDPPDGSRPSWRDGNRARSSHATTRRCASWIAGASPTSSRRAPHPRL